MNSLLAKHTYTQDIRLEQITRVEFLCLKEMWGNQKRLKGEAQEECYYKVLNPLIATDYSRLLSFLLDHPHLVEIAARDEGGWCRMYPSSYTKDRFNRVVETAKNDKRKRNYLEAKFQLTPTPVNAEIGFIEKGGLIIGYEISIPKIFSSLFDVDVTLNPSERGYQQGLAVPIPQMTSIRIT